jgi:hypothetical protein
MHLVGVHRVRTRLTWIDGKISDESSLEAKKSSGER